MIEVGVGNNVSVGEAAVKRDSERVYVRDRYQEASYIVDKSASVVLRPIPPLNVPIRITEYLLLQFEEPILVNKNMNLWVRAPYELAVLADKTVLTYLTPFKVKHTLHGEVIGGTICRHFLTNTYFRRPVKGSEALVKLNIVARSTNLVSGIVIPLSNVKIYVSNGRVYYNVVRVTVNKGVKVELLSEPPVHGAELVDTSLSEAGRFKTYSSDYSWMWGW